MKRTRRAHWRARKQEDEKNPKGALARAKARQIQQQAEWDLNKCRETWWWVSYGGGASQGSPQIREATARLWAAEAGKTGASSSGDAWRGHGWQAGSGASSAGSGWRRHSWDAAGGGGADD